MPSFFRNNGLSIVMFLLCFFALVGQSITGFMEHNDDQQTHNQPEITFPEYLLSCVGASPQLASGSNSM